MSDRDFMSQYAVLLNQPLIERLVVRRFWSEICDNLRTPISAESKLQDAA